MESRIDLAFKFAKAAHGTQSRTTGGLYIEHPRHVASYVLLYKDSYKIENLLIIAILHDVLEDTDATYDQIFKLFGKEVADTVLDLTTNEDEKDLMGKKEYLADKMTNMTSYALVVKLCDRLHNVSDLHKMKDSFRERYTIETHYILDYIDKHRILSENGKYKSTTHSVLMEVIRNTIE